MRPIETLLLSSLFLFAFSLFSPAKTRSRWFRLLPGVSLIRALMGIFLEGLRWVRDISFAMDEMEKLNGGSGFFSGKLDLDRIGVFGVSFGGAASSQACVQEQRCKAAISIDCPQFGDFLDREVNQPIMFMGSEQYKGMNDIFLRTKDNPQYSVMIKKTTHQNLSDVSIWGKLFKMQMLGKIDGQRCLHVQNSYILAFFKKYLESTDNGLLDGPSPEYPEVEFMSRNTDKIQR
jgi:hypothetical protein